MGYPQHWLLQFTGHQGDVNETFSCGIRLAIQSEDPQESVDEEEYLDDVAVPGLTTWFSAPNSLISANAKMLLIKFNEIAPDGKYEDPSITHQRSVNVSGASSQSTALHPLQVSMVLSWRTSAAMRGLASHGRIYVPRPAVAVDAAGDINGSSRVGAAATAVTLLNTLDVPLGVIGGVLRPSILSRGHLNPDGTYGPGAVNQIDLVVVDSQLDIQRRRAFSQTREVTSAPVVYS